MDNFRTPRATRTRNPHGWSPARNLSRGPTPPTSSFNPRHHVGFTVLVNLTITTDCQIGCYTASRKGGRMLEHIKEVLMTFLGMILVALFLVAVAICGS